MPKKEPDIANVHDKFFKQIFSDVSNTSDFIQGILPKQLLSKLDLPSLTLENGTYINKHLKETFSDLIYSINYAGEKQIQISLLFEHKSYPEKFPHIQLLEYQLNVFKSQIKQKKELTPIIPLVVYHGKRTWYYKPFTDYFSYMDETLKAYLPGFEYLLCDFSKLETNDIVNNLFTKDMTKITVALMKLIFSKKSLEESLVTILNIGAGKYTGADGKTFLETVINYLFSAGDIEPEIVIDTVTKISEEGGERAMTTATKLMERGRTAGRQEGESIGIKKAYNKLLASGMTPEQAKKILEL